MEYIGLHIKYADDEQAEILTAELADYPFESFIKEGEVLIEDRKAVEGEELVAYIQKSALADCCEEVDALLTRYGVQGRYVPIAAQNWNAVWESDFPPVEVEGRLVIRAPFHAPAPAGVMEVVLTPHNSFGTGHHATTWIMTRALLDLPLAGRRGLDLGSGTGVLAIVAAKCGAAHVDAADIDDWCEASCRENAAMNGVSDRVNPILGDIFAVAGLNGSGGRASGNGSVPSPDRQQPYDFILENINRNILLEALPTTARLLAPDGVLLMSGFLEADVPILVAAAAEHGLRHTATCVRDGWVMLQFRTVVAKMKF
ncbi:MAG: 50S ribosomal protein L11 methyltransferase [Alistipes senegalensis]|nr:50S ribosomal protein L11 methyltransferase [Bacteroides cellulosilyticus]MCM1352402.1 50S ribosomal protein L11 methyltransferase [Alistipes senegalensis]